MVWNINKRFNEPNNNGKPIPNKITPNSNNATRLSSKSSSYHSETAYFVNTKYNIKNNKPPKNANHANGNPDIGPIYWITSSQQNDNNKNWQQENTHTQKIIWFNTKLAVVSVKPMIECWCLTFFD